MTTRTLFTSTPMQQRIALAILRVVTGAIFMAHGAQKLFVYGLPGVTGAFTKMGVPAPALVGPLVAGLEFFGGLALIVGVLTRLAALGLAFNMLGALFLVHIAAGFFLPAGYEFVLALLAASLALVVAGPGSLSIDEALIARRGIQRGRSR